MADDMFQTPIFSPLRVAAFRSGMDGPKAIFAQAVGSWQDVIVPHSTLAAKPFGCWLLVQRASVGQILACSLQDLGPIRLLTARCAQG